MPCFPTPARGLCPAIFAIASFCPAGRSCWSGQLLWGAMPCNYLLMPYLGHGGIALGTSLLTLGSLGLFFFARRLSSLSKPVLAFSVQRRLPIMTAAVYLFIVFDKLQTPLQE